MGDVENQRADWKESPLARHGAGQTAEKNGTWKKKRTDLSSLMQKYRWLNTVMPCLILVIFVGTLGLSVYLTKRRLVLANKRTAGDPFYNYDISKHGCYPSGEYYAFSVGFCLLACGLYVNAHCYSEANKRSSSCKRQIGLLDSMVRTQLWQSVFLAAMAVTNGICRTVHLVMAVIAMLLFDTYAFQHTVFFYRKSGVSGERMLHSNAKRWALLFVYTATCGGFLPCIGLWLFAKQSIYEWVGVSLLFLHVLPVAFEDVLL